MSTTWEAKAATAMLLALGAIQSTVGFVAPSTSAAVGTAAGVSLRGATGASGASDVALAGAASSASVAGALYTAIAGAAVVAAVARRATRTEWYRRVKRVGGDQAIFDVTLPKPMGLKILPYPQREGVGVLEIVKGGNAWEMNKEVTMNDEGGMWVLEGDRIMAVNDINTEDATVEEITKIVQGSEADEVKLTLMRNTRKGPIKVIMMPEGNQATVKRGARLASAAEYAAGKELKYGCIDGWCGVCWHREKATNGIFKPCCDVLTGEWDNVMPLVLYPKPEKAGDSTFLKPRGADAD